MKGSPSSAAASLYLFGWQTAQTFWSAKLPAHTGKAIVNPAMPVFTLGLIHVRYNKVFFLSKHPCKTHNFTGLVGGKTCVYAQNEDARVPGTGAGTQHRRGRYGGGSPRLGGGGKAVGFADRGACPPHEN